MTDQTHVTLLRRKAGLQTDAPMADPLTSSRAVRLALAKAAQDSIGLPLSVSSVGQETGSLEALLAALPHGLMLVRLARGGRLAGVIALDMQLRAAVVEVQTTGHLLSVQAEERAPTATDCRLCEPLVTAFLTQFPTAVQTTALEGWADEVVAEDCFADQRAAALLLEDVTYRWVQMTVQLGDTDRQGVLQMALPLPPRPAAMPPPDLPAAVDWDAAFRAGVEQAPVMLTALLYRAALPLSDLQRLEVGTVLPMPGCTVSSLRLLGADGVAVATAKLGQSGGKRAVRIELPADPALGDLVAPPVKQAGRLILPEKDEPDEAPLLEVGHAIAVDSALDDPAPD